MRFLLRVEAGAVDYLKQRPDRARAKLRAGVPFQLLECRPEDDCLAVGPVARHSVEGVADEDDATGKRYLLALQAVWIAFAVPAFVLGPRSPLPT